MFDGLISLPVYGYVLVVFGLAHIAAVNTSIYLHRCLAHRAVELHPAVSLLFRICLYLTTGPDVKRFVAVHRKHHETADTEADPHSPQIVGFGTFLWKGLFLYRKEVGNPETVRKYGWGTPEDRLEGLFSAFGRMPGLIFLLAVELLLFGPIPGLAVWTAHSALALFYANCLVNGVGHWWGYRNYEIRESAKNFCPIGLLIAGEELHNNHHAFPGSAKFSRKWWEFDIAWLYIRILVMLRLARVRHP